jgi:IclR family transcriptional regulator, KDG regulon repressor
MSDSVASVERASLILDCFTYEHPERTVSEVSQATGLSSSTAHRLLATLTSVALLERPARGRYRLGVRLHELGQTAVFTTVLREHGHRHLEALRAATGRTTQLAVLSGTDVVYIDRLEDPAMFGRFGRSGQRVPAYACSSGKVLLAFGLPEPDLEAIARTGLTRRAPRTITSLPVLRAELDHTRDRGYAESMEEAWPDMTSIAVPITGPAGGAIAALSIAGPVTSFTDVDRARAARLALTAARTLGRELSRAR